MRLHRQLFRTSPLVLGFVILYSAMLPASAQVASEHTPPAAPWMNTSLSADERAALVVKEMTLDEKISLLHGTGMVGLSPMSPLAVKSNGGAGYVVAIPRLGIPAIQMSDAAYGVRNSGENGRYSTALPDDLAGAASWDLDAAYEYGALIARELRAQGYNMSLGGGVNLAREPRNGRTFEYMGEDPILAGKMVGQVMKGEQAQHVIGDIKHYAMNDQESGRNAVNVNIDKRSMRESDLLAFEIGLRESDAAAVMCAYNRVNGDYACENKYLLTDVLKKDWNFKGFIVSDWQGTHSTAKASAAGLDHEEPGQIFYGDAMKAAVESGTVPMAEVDDHVHRILRSMFATGVIDDPPVKSVVDVEGGFEIAQKIEERSIVLLRNERSQLPLDASKVASIAVIGAHSDVGMISGGGSAQVDPPGGNAIMPPGKGGTNWQDHVWFPTSPLKALREKLPNAKITFDPGTDLQSAASLARSSDLAIVFAYQWQSEGMDLANLSLPDNQDALIEQVAAANPRTIVVLETGTAVTMPWIDKVSGVVEAWSAGSAGHKALANILLGYVNPSGKLAMTFPKGEEDLPRPLIAPLPPNDEGQGHFAVNSETRVSSYAVHYDEGSEVGYKWYEAQHKQMLFPFGFGLSYTSYAYSGLSVDSSAKTVRFTVKNTGRRTGTEIAEVYATLPKGVDESFKRLVGWKRVTLAPGESQIVTVAIDPRILQTFDESRDAWNLAAGDYDVFVGPSSDSTPLTGSLQMR